MPFETFNVHGQVDAAAFNPVNDQLAIGSLDGNVTVLDVATDTKVQELLGHSREITGVVYSPQGSYIATTSFDNTVRVWDVASGQTFQVDHDFSSTNSPFLSPDGKFLIETNGYGQANVWLACPDCEDPTALLNASRAGVISPLTPIEQAQVAAALDRPALQPMDEVSGTVQQPGCRSATGSPDAVDGSGPKPSGRSASSSM